MAFFKHFLRLRRGVADILADEIVARDRDKMAAPDIAEPVQDVGHPQGHRRLAGARIAGEAHMQGRRFVRKAEALSRALNKQQSRDFANAGFHGLEADKFAVELVENFRDA